MVQKTPGSHARLPGVQFVKKRSFFHKPKPYLKWKRGLSPLFQAFFPLQLRFFLTQAAAFVQSQRPAVTQDCRAFLIEQCQKAQKRPAQHRFSAVGRPFSSLNYAVCAAGSCVVWAAAFTATTTKRPSLVTLSQVDKVSSWSPYEAVTPV